MSRYAVALVLALILGPLMCALSGRLCLGTYFIDSDNLSIEFRGTIRKMGFPIWYEERAEPDPGYSYRPEPRRSLTRWLANEALWSTGLFVLFALALRWKRGALPAV